MSSATDQVVALDSAASGGEWPAAWQTHASGVGAGRYTDPTFAQLEFDKLWSRVWQVAARTDEIPEPGDFTTYTIGNQSILVVRVDADNIQAYFNFCPHRGTTLGEGSGHFEGGRIICPFHGWRWNLEGAITKVLERNEFHGGNLADSDIAMRKVHTRVFAGFVFINLAREPEDFDAFIEPLRQFLDDGALDQMRHIWWKRAPIACNWKVAQEAFFEAYHVSATHPQLEKVGSEVVWGDREDGPMMYRDLTYDAFEHGHGQFWGSGEKSPIKGHVQEPLPTDNLVEAMAARMNLTAEGLGGMILKQDIDLLLTLRDKDLPADANLGEEYVKLQYETAAQLGRPMPKLTPGVISRWGGVTFLFPNICILLQAGSVVMYRALPHPSDPNQCTFEIRSTKTYAADEQPTRAEVEDISSADQVGLIPRQDLANLPRVQVGLNSIAMPQTWLAEHQERIILNMHQEEDRYLKA